MKESKKEYNKKREGNKEKMKKNKDWRQILGKIGMERRKQRNQKKGTKRQRAEKDEMNRKKRKKKERI